MAKPLPSMSLVLALGISITALNSPSLATAAIYRCTNAGGEVGFSDEPCPAGFAAETLEVQSRPARGASGRSADNNPYSAIEQVKQLERERARRGRDAVKPDHHARLQDIDQQLRNLEHSARNLRETGGSSFRDQWTREALAKVLNQQEQLRRERDRLSGRSPQTADREHRTRSEGFETDSGTREAQLRAQQAQREAQLRSQEAEQRDQAEKERLNAKSWHTKEPQPGVSAPPRSW